MPVPVPLIKIEPNPETAQRVAEVGATLDATLDAMVRAVAQSAQKACEEMGRSIAALRRPA